MGPDHVITDRGILRERPPDILLTNYKKLDFLLIRPIDHRRWRHNAPDTLRYLVVDELHTFDVSVPSSRDDPGFRWILAVEDALPVLAQGPQPDVLFGLS